MKITLLEDDPYTADLLSGWLTAAGHVPVVFESVQHVIREAAGDAGDLLIIGASSQDGGRQGGDPMGGAQVIARVREQSLTPVPLLRLCPNTNELEMVAALNAGADDCMVKPLRRLEFLARIEALTRRMTRATKRVEVLNFGDLSVDLQNRVILRKGQRVSLTPKSYDLAVFLFSNLGQLLSRSHLMERIWGRGSSTSTRTLDTHISRLRSDLGLTAENGWALQSVYQHGYRLEQVDLHPVLVRHAVSEAQPVC